MKSNKAIDRKDISSQRSEGGYASFGKAVLDTIKEQVSGSIGDETLYEFADLAVKHKLIGYVPYNKEAHGVIFSEYSEEGDMIYYWGDQEA